MFARLTASDASMPRWHARHGLVPFRCPRMSPAGDRYWPLSMAFAMMGARLASCKCLSWLKCASRVLGGAGIDAFSWHGLHTAAGGRLLSLARVLWVTVAWQFVQTGFSCRCRRCEKG